KLFSSLFDFLMQILKIFIDVFGSIIGYIKSSITSLTGQKLMDPSESMWEKLKEIAKLIFSVAVGGSVIYFLKEINNFLLNSFIKIGDLLFKIVLRILDIISIVLKFFFFLFKKVIIILSFFLSFFINFLYFGSVIYFLKEINNFLLNSFIKIGDLLFKIVLRILDIISI
ncbi:hypothetical protein ACMUE1_00645, partial [Candidatus Phytoplasma asteris]